MKKAKIALALFLVLLVVVGVSFASLTEANFKPYHTPTITIFSPAQNQVYHSSNVLLNVSLDRYDTYPPFDIINSLNYSLDGQKDKPLPYTITAGIYCRGKITLSNLSDGPHSVFVHSEAKHGSEIIPLMQLYLSQLKQPSNQLLNNFQQSQFLLLQYALLPLP